MKKQKEKGRLKPIGYFPILMALNDKTKDADIVIHKHNGCIGFYLDGKLKAFVRKPTFKKIRNILKLTKKTKDWDYFNLEEIVLEEKK